MNARVGAKLEVVAPRRVVSPIDAGYLLLLLAVSLGLHGWLVSRIQVTARDGIGFARDALKLHHARIIPARNGDTRMSVQEVLKSAQQPPGYPLAVLGTWEVVRHVWDADLPAQILKSAQIVSLIAAAFLVFPTYWLGRMLFNSKFIGFAGALLFQTLPSIAHLTSDALTESLYLLFASTALLLGLRGLRRRSVGMFLLCGLATGLTYVVRPEGVMFLLAVGTTIAGVGIFRVWGRGEALGRLAALAIGFGLAAAPYMIIINGFSNKNAFNTILDQMKGAPTPLWQKAAEGHGALVRSPALFADFSQQGNRIVWAGTAIAKETSKAAHYAVFVLGLVGIGLHRRRIAADPGLAMLMVLGVINLSVLAVLSLKVGYVSERHTVVLVLVLSLLAAASLEPVCQSLGTWTKFAARGLLLALVAGALPAALKPPHETRLGHPHAGHYLAEHVGPQDALIDPFEWAQWYAGRTLLGVPEDPKPPQARWVVMEPGKSPHSLLPRYESAVAVVADTKNVAELKYWWPEDVPRADAPQKAKVLVYRQAGDGK
ncbi:ArnT family glycosyltransferase [Limnoglobus roseus]|uniref:Putative glycosyltransferase n=1 Tax=Limnoglobus roseus TaxID=2598579 RepID=A0A5C1A9M6_9BACT|nr:glycosyltransferase family 39 protein [Limnoglobus roseus]QEL13824.1 putative glycosyltransferase [Limnoglobus roseus]